MKGKKIFWLVGLLVLLIASPGFSEVKNLDLSKASGSSHAVYNSSLGEWKLLKDPASTQRILDETHTDIEGGTHQFTTPSFDQFPVVRLGTNLGGTGTDGSLDLSLGGGTGGCYGPGMTWTTYSLWEVDNYWSGPTCLIDTNIKSVFNFTTVNIPSGTNVRATGSNPLKIYVTENVTINGVISVSAIGEIPGPGGYGPAQGPGAGQNQTPGITGYTCIASGGGLGGRGGHGMNYNANQTWYQVNGGSSYTVPSDRGGSGGGNLTRPDGTIFPGGAGGGSILIESREAIWMGPNGRIYAVGGAGKVGFHDWYNGYYSGSGSGGRVELAGIRVYGTGRIWAQGGALETVNIPQGAETGVGGGGRVTFRIYSQLDTESLAWGTWVYHGRVSIYQYYAGAEGVLQVSNLPIESAPSYCSGTFTSTVHDLLRGDTHKTWEYAVITPSSTSVQLKVRHGSTPSYDPASWSGWLDAPSSGEILPVVGSRYVQYRVDMTGAGGTGSCTSSPTFGYVKFNEFSYVSGPGIVATDEIQDLRAGLVDGVSINQGIPENTSISWAVSTDGTTWKKYSDGAWQDISSIETGNTANELAGIPSSSWQELGLGLVRFAFALKTSDLNSSPSVSGISVSYSPLEINVDLFRCPQSLYRGQKGSCSVSASSSFGTLSYGWSSSGGVLNPSGQNLEISFDSKGKKTVTVKVYVEGAPEADITKSASIEVMDTPKPSVLIDGPRSVFKGQEVTYNAKVTCPQGFSCLSKLMVGEEVYTGPATLSFTELVSREITGVAWVDGISNTTAESTIKVFVSEMKKPFVSINAPRVAEVGVPITLQAFLSARFGTPVGHWTLPDGTEVEGTDLVYTPDHKMDDLRLSYTASIEGYPETSVTVQSRSIKVDTYELPQFKIKSYTKNSEGYAPYNIALGVTGDMSKVIDYKVGLTHRWDFGDGTVKEGGMPKMASQIYTQPGTYIVTLTVQDDRENSTSDSLTMTILEVPMITIDSFKIYTSNKYNRAPLKVFVRPIIKGGHPRLDRIASYQWTVNGESVGEDRILSVNFNEPGDYVIGLTVVSKTEKTASGEYPITVNPNQLPECTISYVDAPKTKTTKIISSCSDSDGRIVQYNWDLGNGAVSKSSRAFVKYEESGTYQVTLTVKDDSGGEAVFTESVTVQR